MELPSATSTVASGCRSSLRIAPARRIFRLVGGWSRSRSAIRRAGFSCPYVSSCPPSAELRSARRTRGAGGASLRATNSGRVSGRSAAGQRPSFVGPRGCRAGFSCPSGREATRGYARRTKGATVLDARRCNRRTGIDRCPSSARYDEVIALVRLRRTRTQNDRVRATHDRTGARPELGKRRPLPSPVSRPPRTKKSAAGPLGFWVARTPAERRVPPSSMPADGIGGQASTALPELGQRRRKPSPSSGSAIADKRAAHQSTWTLMNTEPTEPAFRPDGSVATSVVQRRVPFSWSHAAWTREHGAAWVTSTACSRGSRPACAGG